MRTRANPRRPVVRHLPLVLVLLFGVLAMHGLTTHDNAPAVAEHGNSDVAPGAMSMTALTSTSPGDSGGGGGEHHSQISTEVCLAVLAAAGPLSLLLAHGRHWGRILLVLRAISRQRLLPRPPRALTPSLAQLCVLRA